MASKFHIRMATNRDFEALVKLEEMVFEKDRFNPGRISYLLTKSRSTILVVEDDSNVIGGAYIRRHRLHHGARLYNIAISPEYQGQGIGLDLLQASELEAARHGNDKMLLEVRADNSGAIRFYEKWGYKIVREESDYYLDGTAAIKMAKKLDILLPSQVKLKIPYIPQTLDFTCGPASLMMALKYFNAEIDTTRTMEMNIWKEATLIFMASGLGGTDGFGLALSGLSRGLSCHMVVSMDRTPMLKTVRSHEKQEVMRIVHNDLKRRAIEAGLSIAFYDFGIEEMVAALYRNELPIVLISTYRLTGDKVPHWVVVTGFDKKNVYIHDPDIVSYKKNQTKARNLGIEKSEFLRMTRYGKEMFRCLIIIGKNFIN